MVIDARSVAQDKIIEADVCIVGAGTAGVVLAREFVDAEFKVCLLESGGFETDQRTQSLSWGPNVGLPYYPLDRTCIRSFGGTSHRWEVEMGDGRLGVRLRPLDPIDFEKRDWVPYSGWPFEKAHLDPFYRRAQSVCQIGDYTYDPQDWEEAQSPRLPLKNGRVETTMFQFGPRDPFVGQYRQEIAQADNIQVYLYANVTDIETIPTAKTVTRLRIACLEGQEFWVSARHFILATGGVQTPRLLLLSNKTQSTGLGNQHDLVGRFFMEHVHLWSGFYIPSDPELIATTNLYRTHMVDQTPVMGKLTLAEKVLHHEKLLSYCVSIHPSVLPGHLKYPSARSKGIDSFKALRSYLGQGRLPEDLSQHLGNVFSNFDDVVQATSRVIQLKIDDALKRFKPPKISVFRLNHMSEQAPNPDSRVTLSDERDILGQRRAQLSWQVLPLDIRTLIRAQEIIDQELQRAGLGRLFIELEEETPPPDLHGGWHNMGTTRMHRDPKQGVVDENSRVHSVSNLFIAGPSVFPTGGYANPVLTFVALTLRLADHIKTLM
jgi:choline dehydrogenase-like flavoprotein